MLDGKIWDDPKVRGVSIEARLLFVFLITEADDEGRLWEAPEEWASRVFGDAKIDVSGLLRELRRKRLIKGYKAEGRRAIFLPAWFQNQTISHPVPSSIMPPTCKLLANSTHYAHALHNLNTIERQSNRSEAHRRKYQHLLILMAKRLDGNARTESGHGLASVRPVAPPS